ncbi:MAG TPA: beta-1,3-glucanase family protein [Chlamydiales bacterium]|nr:beta-1,3-glucanase family protein [Chlamydiales bacterium]
MKGFWLSFICCKCLLATPIFNTQTDLENYLLESQTFYETMTSEQASVISTIGVGTPFTPGTNPTLNPPARTTPPSNPPAPTAAASYLPFVIVNNSTFLDSQVYISIIGAQLVGTTAQTQKMYVTFAGGNTGVGSYNLVPGSGSGSVAPIALTTLKSMGTHTWGFYIPSNDSGSNGISGARVYFQVQTGTATTLITYNNGALTEPSVLNQSLDSYGVSFDKFEFAYVPQGSPQISCDATAVDFFCLPLLGYLSTPDAGNSSTSGIYESQSYVMTQTVPYFFNTVCTSAAILAQWNHLFSPNTASPIRILSPASASSVGTSSSFPNQFDPNYFDNAAAYGFSYLQYLWYGAGSFYRVNPLNFTIPPNSAWTQLNFAARIDSSNNMDFSPAFSTESQSYFPAPSTAGATAPSPNGPTSYQIMAAQNLNPTFAANLQGNQVSKLFEEALMVGLLPVAFPSGNPLSNGYFSANSGSYYSNFNKLPASAGGPWYSLYAQAIHYCGNIYAFGFDEPLYPNVLMNCTTQTTNTYIGITIGTCDLVP